MTRVAARVVLLFATACIDPAAPALERLDPPRGLTDRWTTVVLIGRDLDSVLRENDGRIEAEPWSGSVGDRPLRNLRWVSPARLEAEVPPNLPPGPHVVLLRTDDKALRLVDGFVAVTPVAPRLDAFEPSPIPTDGARVRLTGAGLHHGTRVLVDDREVEAFWLDDRTLELDAPPHAAGFARLEVRTPVGRLVRHQFLFYEDPM